MKFGGFTLFAKPPAETRLVHANQPSFEFPDNAISNTKYNVLTFIPKNLWEQFSRAMNVYFLFIACLQLIKEITPVNPLTTWLPLAVIFGVTAVKEGIDDLGRWKADKAANSRVYTVVRDGRETDVPSAEIRVGDVLKLVANDEVPCDCVLLSSSDAQGNAFIQTTNLDGESNLKVRSAIADTKGLTTPAALGAFRGVVECAPPNEHIYKFDSRLRMTADAGATNLALSSSQLLLQATHVRNVDWLFALVVYTGNESKFGKNKRPPPTKYTRTDDFIQGVTKSIFAFQLLLVLITGIIGDKAEELSFPPDKAWYLANRAPGGALGVGVLVIPLRFLLLNSTMIPISLKLTLDLCKLFYAKFIDGDVNLYDAETDTPARSNSTALSEDLGQVAYILTDKTGTLTENRMVLKAVSVVGGNDFGTVPGVPAPAGGKGAQDGALPKALLKLQAGGILADGGLYGHVMGETAGGRAGLGGGGRSAWCDGAHAEVMRCLALNNDVVPGVSAGGERIYKASSPDEEALVKAAAGYGATLWAREGDVVTIQTGGGPGVEPAQETYTQLAAFEFSSDRKRMSVLLRSEATGAVRLYCKGADDMIMARLAKGQEDLAAPLQERIDAYAATGLRTLVMSYRDVSPEELAAFSAAYATASAAMTDRDAAKEAVYDGMERGLRLVGATAIEDKLQEGVPETIALLRRAGVAFWMLTGDKFSTALTIARTCNLKTKETALIEIDGETQAAVEAAVTAAHARLVSAGHNLTYEPKVGGGMLQRLTSFGAPDAGDDAASRRSSSRSSSVRLNSWHGSAKTAPGGSGGDGSATPGDFDDRHTDLEAAASGAHAARSAAGEGAIARGQGYTVIIRGSTLELALNHCLPTFAAVGLGATAVICCRVTPKQKAECVKLVKRAGHLTLAIGDGGNDVAMIQEAAVGVGIRGKEGLQAARASDYQVSAFRALQRLLLVHGRYSYYRTCLVAQYSFYKSFLFCTMQIGYGYFSGWAGVSLFNSLCVAAYNAVLFVPIVFFLVDRDITQHTALTVPEAYRMCAESTMMTPRSMLLWLLRGLWQAIALLLIGLYTGAGVSGGATLSGDYESLGLAIFFGYMWTQDFTMLLSLRRVAWHNVASIFGMHVLAMGVALVMNAFKGAWSFIDYGSLTNTIGDPFFWLFHLLITIVACGPPAAVANWRAAFQPSFMNALYRLDAANEAAGLVEPGYAPPPGSGGKAGYGSIVSNPVAGMAGAGGSADAGLPLLRAAAAWDGSVGSGNSGSLSKNGQAPAPHGAAGSGASAAPSSQRPSTSTGHSRSSAQSAPSRTRRASGGTGSSGGKKGGSGSGSGSDSGGEWQEPDPEAGAAGSEHAGAAAAGGGAGGGRGKATAVGRTNKRDAGGEGANVARSLAAAAVYNPLAAGR